MTVLVTGAAGFIGSHVVKALAARGQQVLGIDNFNAYYDVRLKQFRLRELEDLANFSMIKVDLAGAARLLEAMKPHMDSITHIVHLAAQAGVRHSIDHPLDYLSANLAGHLHVLELARRLPNLDNLVYASSSSVYGAREDGAFSLADRADAPVSLYAATKRADELMSSAYSHLYRIPQTGLRFFTVYGPAGRPDMAYFKFTEAVLGGSPINVHGDGTQRRDFTYIDDIVAGVVAAVDRPSDSGSYHRLFNLGNDSPEPLSRLIDWIEVACGERAKINYSPKAAGDVPATWADITDSRQYLEYEPKVSLEEGVGRFVHWYRGYVNA